MFHTSKHGSIDVLVSDTPLTHEHVQQLSESVERVLRTGQPRAVLNLQHVALIDSAGLECLVDLQQRFQERAGVLKLAAPTSLCREILVVTGVAKRFEIFSDLNSAIGSFI